MERGGVVLEIRNTNFSWSLTRQSHRLSSAWIIWSKLVESYSVVVIPYKEYVSPISTVDSVVDGVSVRHDVSTVGSIVAEINSSTFSRCTVVLRLYIGDNALSNL